MTIHLLKKEILNRIIVARSRFKQREGPGFDWVYLFKIVAILTLVIILGYFLGVLNEYRP